MQKSALEVVDAGVDWVTITATTKSSALRLLEYGHSAGVSEQAQGNEKRDFQFKGYNGWRVGAVSYGARPDGAIFIARGGLAREHYRSAFEAGTNCSRIDCQVTVRSPVPPERQILNAYKSALKFSRTLRRGPRVDIHRSSQGSSTCYLGSRASEKFGRIYDKGNESLLDVLDGCVRYETEFKGAAALQQIKRVAYSKDPTHQCIREVSEFARIRHVPLELARTNPQTFVLQSRACDHQKSLDWIRLCIRPTVERLVDRGLAAEVYDCLNVGKILQALDTRDNLRESEARLIGAA